MRFSENMKNEKWDREYLLKAIGFCLFLIIWAKILEKTVKNLSSKYSQKNY